MKIYELEAGMRVYYDYSLFHVGEIITIRYTNGTQIVCDDPHSYRVLKFDKYTGLLVGEHPNNCHPRIHILTDEILQNIRREKLLSEIKNTQFQRLKTRSLEMILSIIKSGDKNAQI